jgi:hypothetical protein
MPGEMTEEPRTDAPDPLATADTSSADAVPATEKQPASTRAEESASSETAAGDSAKDGTGDARGTDVDATAATARRSGEPEGPGGAEKKRKPEPIRTLAELFISKTAAPSRLLREMEKGTSWKFADDDVLDALELVPETDPHLARTRLLLHLAIESYDGRFARTTVDFALLAISDEIGGLAGWGQLDDADPVASLTVLSERLGRDLRDSKRQRRALNVLMIATDVLSHRRGLSFELAAPVLRTAVGRPPEYERGRSNPRRHRIASVTLPRNDLERVRDLLDLLEPWERDLHASQQAERAAASDAHAAREAADQAALRTRELTQEVSALASELEALRQEAAASRDQVQDVRINASADVTELRARTVAFLNTRLRDLLGTAKEACEVEPPSIATSVRLLEQALQELRREVEWLTSSA